MEYVIVFGGGLLTGVIGLWAVSITVAAGRADKAAERRLLTLAETEREERAS